MGAFLMTGEGVGPCVLSPVGGGASRYGRLIATGGIGYGILFTLEGNDTLGRNESRRGRLAPMRDYCKLHIISHYVSVLMGAGQERSFEVIPIGRIGDDDAGRRLAAEMSAAGITMDEVGLVPGADTLFSVCFLYPDTSGGNITTAESASSLLSARDIEEAFERHPVGAAPELALAVPEVPVETRVRLLHVGRQRGCRTIASVLPGEVESFRRLSGFEDTDLLAVNTEEARAIAGCGPAESGSAVARDRKSVV
jgi:sugar/nucleoside kinase (ribokinase family)